MFFIMTLIGKKTVRLGNSKFRLVWGRGLRYKLAGEKDIGGKREINKGLDKTTSHQQTNDWEILFYSTGR